MFQEIQSGCVPTSTIDLKYLQCGSKILFLVIVAEQLPLRAMSAPWRRDPESLDARLNQIERRMARVEAILSQQDQEAAAPASNSVVNMPRAPLYPPAGALPKALERLFALKQQSHDCGKRLQLLYDFLLVKFPGAVPQLERIMDGDPLSPSGSDDLDLHPPSPTSEPQPHADQEDEPTNDNAASSSAANKRRRLNRDL